MNLTYLHRRWHYQSGPIWNDRRHSSLRRDFSYADVYFCQSYYVKNRLSYLSTSVFRDKGWGKREGCQPVLLWCFPGNRISIETIPQKKGVTKFQNSFERKKYKGTMNTTNLSRGDVVVVLIRGLKKVIK